MMIDVGRLDVDTFSIFVKKLFLHMFEQYSLVASHPCYHFSFITNSPIFPIVLSLPVQMEIDC
jgi:hypothetical protein